MTGEQNRNTGIDVLRILCMFLVVLSHFGFHSIWPHGEAAVARGQLVVNLASMPGKIAVDCFILITAYFMSEKRVNLFRISRLLLKTLLCSLLIPAFLLLFRTRIAEFHGLLQYLPFMSQSYWFMDNYFLLMLLAPVLNELIHRLSRMQLKALIAAMLIPASIFPLFGLKTDLTGYLFWFVILYLIGGTMRRHEIGCSRGASFTGIVLSFLALLGSIYLIGSLETMHGGQIATGSFYFTDYWQLPVLANAAFLLLLFKEIKICPNALIRFFSSQAIGVYLISDQAALRYVLWRDWLRTADFYYSRIFAGYALADCVLVFLVCAAVSWVFSVWVEKPILSCLRKPLSRLQSWYDSLWYGETDRPAEGQAAES